LSKRPSAPTEHSLAPNILWALALTVVSLIIGMAGYAFFESMNAVDSFVSAAMILSGMGPIAPFKTDAGKIFAGCYALYSGLVVLVTAGLILAPVLHNVLHRFHLGDE
jgi:hypothetical protein